MPRVRPLRVRQDPACPPHQWQDVSERAGYYLLRCAECGAVFPPDERGYS